MDWILRTVQAPEFLLFALTGIVGLFGYAIKGAKAKFMEELVMVIDDKFDSHEKLENSHDEAVAQSIATLQDDMTEVKADVRDIAADLKTIMSNGFLKHGK